MRCILLILTLVGLTASTGCRMCAHPYDDCGPTFVGECGPVVCNPYARAGSVLSPPLTPGDEQMVSDASSLGVDGSLEPIPQGEELIAPPTPTVGRVIRMPSPPRSARTSGPTYLR